MPNRGSARVLMLVLIGTLLVAIVAVNAASPRFAGSVATGEAPGASPGSPDRPLAALSRSILHPADDLMNKATAASARVPKGIVRAVGTHLVIDGRPWRFMGFNDYKLTSQSYTGYTCGGEHSDKEVDADFAQMHDLGVTVVRAWFFQSYVIGRHWQAFDRVLAAAARHQIRVIPVLANQWGSCEDYDRSPLQYKSLAWYQSGYRTDLDYGLPLSYRDYALSVVRHYAGDARVAFWQLMNEAEAADSMGGPCHEVAAAHAIRAFADDMAEMIKAADPVHLISLGTIGGGQCGSAGADYQFIHAGTIDLCEVHDYSTVPQSAARRNPCLTLHKPTFIGERGFAADLGTGVTNAETLRTRSSYVATDIINTFAADGCAGYLLWSWTSASSVSYDIAAEDPIAPVFQELSRTHATALAIYVAVWAASRGGPRLQSDS